MGKDNLSAILYKINDIRLEETEIPEPKDDEVLLEMGCVGICGSDVHYLVNGRIGDAIVTMPMITGHEAAGTVSKLGKNVKSLKVGDRVAIEPGVPCSACDFCRLGRYNLCKKVIFCATPPIHGNLRRYYTHAANFCYKLPDNVSLEEGALLEPLNVGVYACKRAEITLGSQVLILGAGPIGLVTLLVAKSLGATQVIITDLVQTRLDVAKKLGADATLLVERTDDEATLVKKIHDLLGCEPDKTIDASGAEVSTRLAVLATRAGGIIVLVGMGPSEMKLPLMHALSREIDIKGVFRYANCYPPALELVASGKVDIKQLITHNYNIEETLEAFETAKTGRGNAIKVMIHCNRS